MTPTAIHEEARNSKGRGQRHFAYFISQIGAIAECWWHAILGASATVMLDLMLQVREEQLMPL